MFDDSQRDEHNVPSMFFVSKKHIEEGMRRIPSKCAVALSLRESGLSYPTVGKVMIYFTYKGIRYFMKLNKETRREIEKFDREECTTPFVVSGFPKQLISFRKEGI